jgi:hypothetical protein
MSQKSSFLIADRAVKLAAIGQEGRGLALNEPFGRR